MTPLGWTTVLHDGLGLIHRLPARADDLDEYRDDGRLGGQWRRVRRAGRGVQVMKDWFLQKTLVVNAAVIALAYWFRGSSFYVDPMVFVWVVAVANLVLRVGTRQALRFRRSA